MLHRLPVFFALHLCTIGMMCAATDGVHFVTNTPWQDVVQTAKAQKKLVFLDAYTDWCGWCKEMDKKTFTDERVASALNTQFVCTKVEMETGEGIDLAMKYGVRGFPTFLVFDGDGNIVYRITGYSPPDEFLKNLALAVSPAAHERELGRGAGLNVSWAPFMRAAYAKAKERTVAPTEEVTAWLKAQKDWTSEAAWGVIFTFDTPAADSFVVANRKQLGQLYGRASVQRRLSMLTNRSFSKAVSSKSETDLASAIAVARSFYDGKNFAADSVFYVCRFASSTKQWGLLGSTLLAAAKTDNIMLAALNEHAWNMYETCSDAAALKDATAAMEIALKKTEGGYAELDTYASLLYKTGRFADGETVAQKAIAVGKANGEDVSATETLLKSIRAAHK